MILIYDYINNYKKEAMQIINKFLRKSVKSIQTLTTKYLNDARL